MDIEEYDPRRHYGDTEDWADIVVRHGTEKVHLTEGEAYNLCYDILSYLNK